MATLWLTYAWDDNRDKDVDFIAQQLMQAGVTVKLDRWNIGAGRRLWEQIASFITDPGESDAWAIYATTASLSSERCREELAYALSRALSLRSDKFPVIALFPTTVDPGLIPASIKIRLYISLADVDWKERTVAAAEGRAPAIVGAEIEPYVIKQHPAPFPFKVVFEVRPRAGSWYPFMAVVRVAERERAGLALRSGPRGQVPSVAGVVLQGGEGVTENGEWYYEEGGYEATPTRSYYLFFKELPTTFGFGQPNTKKGMYFWSAPTPA